MNFIKNKYFLLTIVLLMLIGGCKSSKDKFKSDIDRTLTETTKTKTVRVGDTVRFEVPNIVLKDTIIYKKNYVTGTTQILRYDKKGRMTDAECISAAMEIFTEQTKLLIEKIEESTKHKENEISASVILYFFIGLALFLVIVFTVAFYVLKKYLKTIIPIP